MPSLPELQSRLPGLMVRDQHRLQRRLDQAQRRRGTGGKNQRAVLTAIAAAIEAAEQRVENRRASVPQPRYPAGLPLSERKDDVLAAIRDHQLVIVAGETGSGKSTQLPKICLELGRGVQGLIGHTQPRRLAARSVAERIAEELGTEVGETVGYAVRFTDRVGEGTLVKLMTDGILLAEIQRDRLLTGYDTIIVDEAHERSLNIDFILGYLKQLLPRRPDLKVIVTSATIDTERFSRHFGDAPVVEVSGRTYPVELRYEPEEGEDTERDQVQAICDAVEELCAEGPGDILVFLSGEREIRDTADALGALGLPDTELLPLYARLSAAEQHRVFASHPGRRVVLATNVAETSVTVPGIRYVVDPGTARISRYSRRTKVQRLPIEPVSQASANQRSGRCGRVAPGICIRLYAEDDFTSRPEFTEPEILRTNLASVILQMAALGLGDVAGFPFVDPPDARNIKDGVALLEELGALDPAQRDPERRLTALGRRLAQLPLDPRLGRMVLEADGNGCLHEVMVIAAALSIQDPRERPVDKQQAAAEQHGRFTDGDSDFLSYLRLWDYLQERQEALSSSQFRKLCKAEFLNYLRIREWQDIYSQLRQVTRTIGLSLSTRPPGVRGVPVVHSVRGVPVVHSVRGVPVVHSVRGGAVKPEKDAIHRSLLAGLLSHIGLKEGPTSEYQGARGARFAVAPGSALFKKSPRWVMAAELVETNRMWARGVARIQPEWAESLGGHLVKRTYSEPHWDAERGAAMALERVTLYGLPIVTARQVNYDRVDPAGARELFIRHALVEGDWRTHHRFLDHNRMLIEEVRALEDRARRRDLLADDEVLFDFYDQRIDPGITSARHFDRWWKAERTARPDLLDFTPEMLVNPRAGEVSTTLYPDTWDHGEGDLALPLSYEFEPGSDTDGVTVHLPLPVLTTLSAAGAGFDWQVPGLREELVTAHIRSLPKTVRRSFVPAGDYARAFLRQATPADGPLLDTLAAELRRMTGDPVPPGSWQPERVPDHLKMSFRVEDESGTTLAVGKDLEALGRQLRGQMREEMAEAAPAMEQTGLRTWSFAALPRSVEARWAGHPVTAYPALVDEGETVGLRTFPTPAEQERAMWAGTRRLLLLNLPSPTGSVKRQLANDTKLALARNPYPTLAELFEDCVACAVDQLVADHGGPAWDEDRFEVLRDAVHGGLVDTVVYVVTVVGGILAAAGGIGSRLDRTTAPPLQPAVADMRSQLSRLAHPGFVSAVGAGRLPDVLRYLQAIDRRLDKLAEGPDRDHVLMAQVQRLERQYQQLLADLPPGRAAEEVEHVRWMIEELRVSSFAQMLGTAHPVSEKRILREIDRLAHHP
jgi:ATP-dependent helicase HrpA